MKKSLLLLIILSMYTLVGCGKKDYIVKNIPIGANVIEPIIQESIDLKDEGYFYITVDEESIVNNNNTYTCSAAIYSCDYFNASDIVNLNKGDYIKADNVIMCVHNIEFNNGNYILNDDYQFFEIGNNLMWLTDKDGYTTTSYITTEVLTFDDNCKYYSDTQNDNVCTNVGEIIKKLNTDISLNHNNTMALVSDYTIYEILKKESR